MPDGRRRTRVDPLLAGCCALYLLVGVAHVFWGAISPLALTRTGGSAADLSALLFAQFTGFLLGVLATPVLAPRLGFRVHIALGLLLALLSLVTVLAVSTTATLALAGSALGFGAGSLEAGAGALVLGPGRSSRQLAMLELFFGLGALGFPIAVFATVGHTPWEHLVVALACLVAVVLVGWVLARRHVAAGGPGRDPAADPAPGGGPRPARRARSGAAPNLLVGFAFVYAGIETNAANFLPRMLGAADGDATAILAVSAFWVGIVLGRLLVGVLGERTVAPAALVGMTAALFATTAGLGLFGLPGPGTSLVWIGLMGLSAGGIFPCALTMATRLAARPPRTTTSLFVAAASLGGALIALPTGVLVDRWAGPGGVTLLASLAAALVVVALVGRRATRRAPTPA